ncbi:hypothetical protein AURDEDRAFT_159379 [Auricularia subglabra TFB-10046 SS5]|nr:hypothetical protein AURDEDRAFT_159379 [Auricularia subglabra TFB-10046 SS5]
MRTDLVVEFLSILRVLLYCEVTTDSLHQFVSLVLGFLPAWTEIARHKHCPLHQVLRRVACAALLRDDIFESMWMGPRFASYLLALAHSQPCSKEDWAPGWGRNFEAALALTRAVALAPSVVCEHVGPDLESIWDHAKIEISARPGNVARAERFCGVNAGMSYMSPQWRLKTPATSRTWREPDYGLYPVNLQRRTNAVWNALQVARFREHIGGSMRPSRRKTLRAYLEAQIRNASAELPTEDNPRSEYRDLLL